MKSLHEIHPTRTRDEWPGWKAVGLLLSLCAASAFLALFMLAKEARGETGPVCEEATGTLGVLCSFPRHETDEEEPTAIREARLVEIAEAIDGATDDRTLRAMLLSLGWHESRYASYIFEGRCSDGPPGQRCDDGKSFGIWQQRPSKDEPVPATVAGQAERSVRLLRFGWKRCKGSVKDPVVGSFASYGSGGRCAPADFAKRRAATARRIVGRL